MDLLNMDEPDSNYWFGFGRIAEQYGETESALENSERATKPSGPLDIPRSSYKLAQMRLAEMEKSR
jgi:hypothetical protein